MTDHLAIKRLTASDCTLFKEVFRTINAGNQKSINLNADVLTGRLYPGLAAAAATTDNEIALAISIFGPDAKPAHKLSRKIIKNATYKNWRLNGEFIPSPDNDPTRYNGMRPDDLAIMAFKGIAVPSGMDLILVSAAAPSDVALLKELNLLFGNRSMIEVTPAEIAIAAMKAGVPDTHPVQIAAADMEIEAALEDAAQGGIEGTRKLLRNRSGRPISAADLAKAKIKAGVTGQEGEGLVNAWLASQVSSGNLAQYTWISADNAVAPLDFSIVSTDKITTLIDVKSTAGPFANVIHLSIAEVIEAAGSVPYRIYRVFDINDDGGKLRISDDIGPLARTLKTLHEAHMPIGVRADGFSVATAALIWGDENYIERPEDEETA